MNVSGTNPMQSLVVDMYFSVLVVKNIGRAGIRVRHLVYNI